MAWRIARLNLGSTGTNGQGRRRTQGQRAIRLAVQVVGVMVATAMMGGCEYLNLPNSFMNPAEVGRFDHDTPWGMNKSKARPVKWPILEQIDLVDEPSNHWSNATDPVPEDLVQDNTEYKLGAGDAVRVSIFELLAQGMDFVKEIRINELGMLSVQSIGSFDVKGLTATQVEQKIAQMLVDQKLMPAAGPGQPGPQVSVMLLESRQKVFSILGAAGRPGTYNILSNDFKLLDALSLAGDVPVQPGMEYLYIIRQAPYSDNKTQATTPAGTPGGVTVPGTTVAPETGPAQAPADILQGIEQKTTTPPATTPVTEPATGPATGPGARAPLTLLRPLPTAMVVARGSELGGRALAQATAATELEAALGVTATTSAPAASTLPQTGEPGAAATMAADQAVPSKGGSEQNLHYEFVEGKWVAIPGKARVAPPLTPATPKTSTSPATVAGTPPMVPGTGPGAVAGATTEGAATQGDLTQQRVIKIPLSLLREGVSKYNVLIRPGDVLNVPPVEPGEFYMMGNVQRPGVYSLSGRRITLKMAVAAAGNLGSLAIPRRCELIRRVGETQEAIVQVNLQAVFDGTQPDIFLKANDVLNVGTDAVAPFIAVMRNAYRASYGWGFVYDKNLNNNPNGQ